MDISGELSMIVQANSLHAVRSTMAQAAQAAQGAPPTAAAQSDVILQLSSAAQQLMQGHGTASHPTP
jgi:hypothetical protein